MTRADDLSRPRRRSITPKITIDPDTFGRMSERLARFFGTARYLITQTVIVVLWITYNVVIAVRYRFDSKPFILLNLLFSTQAAYAAPLILLAQTRQEARDRAQNETDRELNFRTQSDAEFLARELAAIRLALQDMVTNRDLGDALDRLTDDIESLKDRRGDKPKPKKKKNLGDRTPPETEPEPEPESEPDEDNVL